MLDFYNNLTSGSSATVYVENKLRLLELCNGSSFDIETNIRNHAKNIERACVGVLALLIRPEDLDAVTCLYCGNCPKVVNRFVFIAHRLNSHTQTKMFVTFERSSTMKFIRVSFQNAF